jgi:hypothetical protein
MIPNVALVIITELLMSLIESSLLPTKQSRQKSMRLLIYQILHPFYSWPLFTHAVGMVANWSRQKGRTFLSPYALIISMGQLALGLGPSSSVTSSCAPKAKKKCVNFLFPLIPKYNIIALSSSNYPKRYSIFVGYELIITYFINK